MATIMDGEATPAQIGALLAALAVRGETEDEVVGFARTMRDRAIPFPVEAASTPAAPAATAPRTFNISTVASLRGRGLRGQGGQARQPLGERELRQRRRARGARRAHRRAPRDRARAGSRRRAGPFSSPPPSTPRRGTRWARARSSACAPPSTCSGPSPTPRVRGPDRGRAAARADRASWRGAWRAWACAGPGSSTAPGLDELTLAGATAVAEVRGASEVRSFTVTPERRRPRLAEPQGLRGGDAARNAGIAREVLGGGPGPRRDVVLLNAAAALLVAERRRTWREGVAQAAAAIDDGRAAAVAREGAGDRLMGRAGGSGPRSWPVPASGCASGKAAVPLEQILATAPPPRPHRAFGQALGRGQRERDRRVQAAVALARHDPRGPRPRGRGQAYEAAGAAALSVLTEEDYFAAHSRTCGGPVPPPCCPSCARTSSSIPTRSGRRGSPAPTPSS